MSTEISTKVSLDLHPDNLKSIEGYSDETRLVLGMTESAFDAAYKGVITVANAREKASTNPSWTEAEQVIQTQELADKVMVGITKGFDAARTNLVKGINYLEGELNMPLTQQASGSVAAEIRAYAKALPTEKLHKFVAEAMDGGDTATLSAVLRGPAYLSGLTADMQKTYIRVFNEKNNPEKAARLRVMQGAKERIENRSGIVFKELERAVGMRPDKVRALRQAKTEAEKAFLLKGA